MEVTQIVDEGCESLKTTKKAAPPSKRPSLVVSANTSEDVKEETPQEVTFVYKDQSFVAKKEMADEHRKAPSSPESSTSSLMKTYRLVGFRCNICEAAFSAKKDMLRHCDAHGDLGAFSTVLEPGEENESIPNAEEHSLNSENSSRAIKKHRKHNCNICQAYFSCSEILYNHYKSVHDIDNPYLRGSISHDKPRQFMCKTCGANFRNASSVSRHRKNVHLEDGASRGICHHCGVTFRLSTLPAHEKKCISRQYPRRRQDCSHLDCKATFYRKEELIKHVKSVHRLAIEPMRTLNFDSEEEFFKWKEEEEDRTFSFYTKHAGTKKRIMTFYCQHEGSSRMHRSIKDLTKGTTKANKKGRIKKGTVCTSYLRANVTDTGVVAYYYPTHNHAISPDDVKHQPLSKEIIQFVKEQVALNVPARQIQVMVKKRLSETRSSRRDAQISIKRIMSLARRYHRETSNAPSIPNISVESFNSFIDALCAQDDSPVLFYQPPSDNALLDVPNEEDHLFFLGLQTVDQQKMLQRETAMPMFISVTKSEFTLQYFLISIVVPCERNFEYPVAHLISSQMNEDVISLFLQTIGERCPVLNVNCIVSCDCPEINGAIRKVFGADGPYFLSKWHFLEYMRKDFFKTVPSNRVEELFDFVLAMADAESEDRFLFLYNSFKEQFESSFPDVVSNFSEYFVRAGSWASCYRQDQPIIDSCLYADSFFNKFNKKYRRRPTKSINILPDVLLFLQESYRDRRENKDLKSQLAEDMKEQHDMALGISSDLVQETLSRHWTVQASKHGQAFIVMQCVSKCYEKDCSLQCKDCVKLCSHMFFCTCDKTDSICLHIHKVFLLQGFSEDEEEGCEDACALLQIEEQDDVRTDDQDDDIEPGNLSPDRTLMTAVELIDAEAKRENILKNLDSLRQIVDQRCLPEEIVNVINETIENLCNLIDNS